MLGNTHGAEEGDESFNVQRIADVVYGQVDGYRLLLDLFLPKNKLKSRGAILLFHGGGWAHGSRYWTNGWANLLISSKKEKAVIR